MIRTMARLLSVKALLGGVKKHIAKHEAEIEVCRIGLALKLYLQQNQTYPETLDKLAPEFLEKIPVDPFSGKAFIYKKAGHGFILYSIGPNMRDDGGKPMPSDRKGMTARDYDNYDIVWKCNK